MAYTRKDYEETVKILHDELDKLQVELDGDLVELWAPREAVEALHNVTKGLADMFGARNPRFDRDRFIKAAGFEGF